jgi:hypothetical protein
MDTRALLTLVSVVVGGYVDPRDPEVILTPRSVPKATSRHDLDNLDMATFTHGVLTSLCGVFFSEVGDKTFLIACLLAMRHSPTSVYFGAVSAAAAMHLLSSSFGYAVTFLPRRYIRTRAYTA